MLKLLVLSITYLNLLAVYVAALTLRVIYFSIFPFLPIQRASRGRLRMFLNFIRKRQKATVVFRFPSFVPFGIIIHWLAHLDIYILPTSSSCDQELGQPHHDNFNV
jgi:hypothetical protein